MKGPIALVVVGVAFLLFGLVSHSEAQLSQTETSVLDDFRTSFPDLADDWVGDANGACKNWAGIDCNFTNTTLTQIQILQGSIKGYIPESVNNLTGLYVLRVHADLTQPLPSFNKMTTLELLSITGWEESQQGNGGQQSIPDVTSLKNLRIFELTGLDLIPPITLLSNLTNLNQLSMRFCNVKNVPDLSALTNLESLNLDGNNFVDPLPAWIGDLTNLTSFSYSNELAAFPVEMAKLVNLKTLDLSHNKLAAVPDFIFNLTKLETLFLSHNLITGLIPSFSQPALKTLILGYNNFSGDVESAFQSLSLDQCDVSFNPLLICPSSYVVCCQKFNSSTATAMTTAITTATTATTATTTTTKTTTMTTTASSTSASTTGNCIGYACTCSSLLTSISTTAQCRAGTWVINGNATNDNTVTIGQQDVIVVNGTFVQNPQAALEVHSGGKIVVTQDAQLGGSLIIVISSNTGSGEMITVMNATNITGRFDKIEVQRDYKGSNCYVTKATPTYTSTSVSVLLTQTKKSSCGDSKGKTVGIAVGVSLGAIIILMIIIVVAIIVYKKVSGPQRIRMSPSDKHGHSVL